MATITKPTSHKGDGCNPGKKKALLLERRAFLLKIINSSGLIFGLRFFEADDAIAIFPLSTFAEQIDALEAFENCAILFTAAAGGLETVVL